MIQLQSTETSTPSHRPRKSRLLMRGTRCRERTGRRSGPLVLDLHLATRDGGLLCDPGPIVVDAHGRAPGVGVELDPDPRGREPQRVADELAEDGGEEAAIDERLDARVGKVAGHAHVAATVDRLRLLERALD